MFSEKTSQAAVAGRDINERQRTVIHISIIVSCIGFWSQGLIKKGKVVALPRCKGEDPNIYFPNVRYYITCKHLHFHTQIVCYYRSN